MVVWLAATNYFLQVEKGLFFSFLFWKMLPEGVYFSINLFAVFQYLLSAAAARNQFVLFKHNIENVGRSAGAQGASGPLKFWQS